MTEEEMRSAFGPAIANMAALNEAIRRTHAARDPAAKPIERGGAEATESERLRAERDAALADAAALREALAFYAAPANWRAKFQEVEDHAGMRVMECDPGNAFTDGGDHGRAALSTPDPGAALIERVRAEEREAAAQEHARGFSEGWDAAIAEATERCEIGPSDEWSAACRDGYLLAAREIKKGIRALGQEGEG